MSHGIEIASFFVAFPSAWKNATLAWISGVEASYNGLVWFWDAFCGTWALN